MEPPPLPPENSESAPTTNKMAVTSMVLGIIGCVALPIPFFLVDGKISGGLLSSLAVAPLASVFAIICGRIAQGQMRESARRATAGMIIGSVAMGLSMLVIVLTLVATWAIDLNNDWSG
jgi:VIT1/CCC1 family predicted Fe2+/Mn2+ transporter